MLPSKEIAFHNSFLSGACLFAYLHVSLFFVIFGCIYISTFFLDGPLPVCVSHTVFTIISYCLPTMLLKFSQEQYLLLFYLLLFPFYFVWYCYSFRFPKHLNVLFFFFTIFGNATSRKHYVMIDTKEGPIFAMH